MGKMFENVYFNDHDSEIAKIGVKNMSNTFKISEYTTIKESTNSSVNHPKHYNFGTIEVIDVIEDWNLNFCLGNAIKYIGRCEHKGHKKEDRISTISFLLELY